MISFPNIARQIVTFVLTVFLCIYSSNSASFPASTSNADGSFSTQELKNNSRIATMSSGDCEEIGDNDEKKDQLAKKIVGYMESKGYEISRSGQQRNIVYIEGACSDGTPNADEADLYNDRRIVFEFVDGEPKIIGNWLATTEPGTYYTKYPLNPQGAARISFGQYKNAYIFGTHVGPSGRSAHEGLIQVGNVTFTRDVNKDGFRTRDPVFTGNPKLNQHKGGGDSSRGIGRQSAGCLVGWSPDGHTEFINILKRDARYQGRSSYRFTTTLINGDDFGAFS
jgi:hypothetical protein